MSIGFASAAHVCCVLDKLDLVKTGEMPDGSHGSVGVGARQIVLLLIWSLDIAEQGGDDGSNGL